MAEFEYIEHEGFVEEVTSKCIRVRIVNESACASCHAKGACTAADLQDKIIDVYQHIPDLQVGQRVMLVGRKSIGGKAVLYAYVLPVILIFITLFSAYFISGNELVAGVLSLAIMIPYFTVIYFMRDKLQKTLSFTIKYQIN